MTTARPPPKRAAIGCAQLPAGSASTALIAQQQRPRGSADLITKPPTPELDQSANAASSAADTGEAADDRFAAAATGYGGGHRIYAEVFFDPQAHTSRGIAFATVIEGIHRAQQEAEASFGLRSQLIICFLRDMSVESALETLERSLPYRDRIVGVGLDSDEKNNPPLKFKEVFARAREVGSRLTMHCDVDQENSVEHIRQCLDEVGVERIDHGVNAVEDPALLDEIRNRGLG